MEMFSRDQVDTFLPRTAVWWKDFNLPASPTTEVVMFSRLSKRKKLLGLIFLTDPENDQLPALLSSSHAACAGGYAWNALNWVLLDKQRVDRLLLYAKVNDHKANDRQFPASGFMGSHWCASFSSSSD